MEGTLNLIDMKLWMSKTHLSHSKFSTSECGIMNEWVNKCMTWDRLSPNSSGLLLQTFDPGNSWGAITQGCHSWWYSAPCSLPAESFGQSGGQIYVPSHPEDSSAVRSFYSLQPDTALNLCCQASLGPSFARTIKDGGKRGRWLENRVWNKVKKSLMGLESSQQSTLLIVLLFLVMLLLNAPWPWSFCISTFSPVAPICSGDPIGRLVLILGSSHEHFSFGLGGLLINQERWGHWAPSQVITTMGVTGSRMSM